MYIGLEDGHLGGWGGDFKANVKEIKETNWQVPTKGLAEAGYHIGLEAGQSGEWDGDFERTVLPRSTLDKPDW